MKRWDRVLFFILLKLLNSLEELIEVLVPFRGQGKKGEETTDMGNLISFSVSAENDFGFRRGRQLS